MSTRIFIVEHRRGSDIDVVVAHVASSKEKAQAFCRANPDFDDGDDWWWAIFSVEVDSSTLDSCEDLHYLYADGTPTYGIQPIPPETN